MTVSSIHLEQREESQAGLSSSEVQPRVAGGNAKANNGADPNDIDKLGYTSAQRFFMAYANVSAQNITDKEIRNRVKTDVHSQGRWRVDGALPHIDAWYDAFHITEKDKMFIPKTERLNLW